MVDGLKSIFSAEIQQQFADNAKLSVVLCKFRNALFFWLKLSLKLVYIKLL